MLRCNRKRQKNAERDRGSSGMSDTNLFYQDATAATPYLKSKSGDRRSIRVQRSEMVFGGEGRQYQSRFLPGKVALKNSEA
jgi:hypothetical protein